jgi:hypothetical chaperone protein
MNFLALDFGTSNCVAGVVTNDKKLSLVPLENESPFMPSSIFVKVGEGRLGPNLDANIDGLVKRALEYEQLRFDREVEAGKKRLTDFRRIYEPRARAPNKPLWTYKKSVRKYVEPEDLNAAIAYFERNDLVQEVKRISATIKPVPSQQELWRSIQTQIGLNSITSDIQLLQEDSFFKAILREGSEVTFGNEALQSYSENPLSGFFMRSPKAFLGTNLNSSYIELFTRVISLMIAYIKRKAESHLEKSFHGVVLGRPVNYMGGKDASANLQALKIMRDAALRAGFRDVRFVVEPFAAAIVARRTMFAVKGPAIVIDIGGGTTDVAVISPSHSDEEVLRIDSSAGHRIGGDDFDQSIALNSFKGELTQGQGELHKIVVGALSTRDIRAQAEFARSGQSLVDRLRSCKMPVLESRLFQVFRSQLQHQIIIFSEKLKISLGKNREATEAVTFLNPQFSVFFDKARFVDTCESHIRAIEGVVTSALDAAGLPLDSPKRVFITGGMANSTELIDSIREFFPKGSSFAKLPPFQSIVSGLGVVAYHLSMYEIGRPIDEVRGVPVERLD